MGSNQNVHEPGMMAKKPQNELDTKLTIVMRADKSSGIQSMGASAKLASLAVIRAYE